MPTWVPFTAQINIQPGRPGKRVEYIRELQRLAYLAYTVLDPVGTLNIGTPGGGQARNYDAYSDAVYGTAVKPQFGETTPQLTIAGFYDIGTTAAPMPEYTLFNNNQVKTGPGNQPWLNNTPVAVLTQVKALVLLLETYLSNGMPDQDPTVFRLEYANVVFGDRGRSFPR